ncbi:MAG: ubiquinol-cytochrome c reductase iron-sulfur subunit [Pelagibacterales bacterium]|nr:ubiquinol-cytochrome c reductase iron-sulfur subunit [Pelagibacterales bacterium]
MTESKKSLNRRNFLANLTKVMGGVGGIFAVIPFLSTMSPSEKAKSAGAPIEIDVSGLKPGAFKVVEWRGKPVWVVRRTAEMINNTQEDNDILTDPKSLEEHQPKYTQNKFRSLNPEYLVLLGICTHLGCSPLYKPNSKTAELGLDWKGGFFCPCHGSKFDLSGRVHRGMPAPYNLEVPPYYFASESKIIVGKDGENA